MWLRSYNKMDKAQKLKLIGYVVLVILVANMILFAMQLVSALMFWVVIALGALFVWKGLPLLRERMK